MQYAIKTLIDEPREDEKSGNGHRLQLNLIIFRKIFKMYIHYH